jgi:hypothetical protein
VPDPDAHASDALEQGVDETVESILQAHLLTGPRPGQCSCGYGSNDKPFPVRELGRPHARHVVQELRATGVLVGRLAT